MNISKKPKINIVEEVPGVSVYSLSGDPLFDFPGEVVAGMRHLITRLHSREGLPRRLAMVAALRSEGVSYLSQALAATLATDLDKNICLVDLNFWWPGPLEFPEDHYASLSEVIANEASLNDAVIPTELPNLSIVIAGSIPRNSRTTVAYSPRLSEVIEELSDRFDMLILDIPAVLATTDAVALAGFGTAACLVIHQGVTKMDDVYQALDEIEHLDILGVVMNRIKMHTPPQIVKMTAF